MQTGQPSRTALGAAIHRAAHQVLEHGAIFSDPLALPILGPDAERWVAEVDSEPHTRLLRLFIAVRSRFAEDAVVSAVAKGLRQVVVLGAGLDTFAYRADPSAGLRVFEVDHPATQAWKREQLRSANVRIPDGVTFAPVDFEHDTLESALTTAGFDPSLETFFTWLGVVPYLTEEAVFSTLEFIATSSRGAHVVFDYGNSPASLSEGEGRAVHDALAERVARAGESFRSYFETETLANKLRALGFREIEDLGAPEIAARYFPSYTGTLRERGGHVVRASLGARSP